MLKDFGYYPSLDTYLKDIKLDSFELARVISEHKERYHVVSEKREYEAEIIGNLRYSANSRKDLPATGDWVAISEYDENKVLIHAVLPRKSILERQSVGKSGEKQIIASNVDCAFIVQAVDRDFNINRIERYLALCNSAGIKAILILSKSDLIPESDLLTILDQLKKRIKKTPIYTISNLNLKGIVEVQSLIEKGMTYCLLGSSGVGKSSLLNNLLGKNLMDTGSISSSNSKGRHITSHRELVILPNGGILIDNPGMREVGITDSDTGLELTFDEIAKIALQCKFKDCKHINEKACAVKDALQSGKIDSTSYENYLKLVREKNHFESTLVEKRRKDKDFGKMIKEHQNMKKILRKKHNGK